MQKFLKIMPLALVLLIPMLSAYGATGGTQSATGSVTINAAPATCNIQLDTTSISYPAADAGSTVQGNTLMISNTGNTPTDILTVTATDWLSDTGVPEILVGNTQINTNGGGFSALTSPTSGGPPATSTTSIGNQIIAANGGMDMIDWKLTANLVNPTFSGPLTQDLTFTSGC